MGGLAGVTVGERVNPGSGVYVGKQTDMLQERWGCRTMLLQVSGTAALLWKNTKKAASQLEGKLC